MKNEQTVISSDNYLDYQNRNYYEKCLFRVRVEDLLNNSSNTEVKFSECTWEAVAFTKNLGFHPKDNSILKFPVFLKKLTFLNVAFANKVVFLDEITSVVFDSCFFSRSIVFENNAYLESISIRSCKFESGRIEFSQCPKIRDITITDCFDLKKSPKEKRVFLSIRDSKIHNFSIQGVVSEGTCLVTKSDFERVSISYHNQIRNFTFLNCDTIGKVDINDDNQISYLSFKEVKKISEFIPPRCNSDLLLVFDSKISIDYLRPKVNHNDYLEHYYSAINSQGNAQQYFHSMYSALEADLKNHYHPNESIRLTKTFLKYQAVIHYFASKSYIDSSNKSDLSKKISKLRACLRYYYYRFGYGFLSGYGLSPVRMLFLNFGVIILFSFVYLFSNIINGGFLRALYFSGIIYTTIGLLPSEYSVTSGCEIIIIIEGVLGVLFLAYTMAVILEYTKRNSRI